MAHLPNQYLIDGDSPRVAGCVCNVLHHVLVHLQGGRKHHDPAVEPLAVADGGAEAGALRGSRAAAERGRVRAGEGGIVAGVVTKVGAGGGGRRPGGRRHRKAQMCPPCGCFALFFLGGVSGGGGSLSVLQSCACRCTMHVLCADVGMRMRERVCQQHTPDDDDARAQHVGCLWAHMCGCGRGRMCV